ncbi:hypothetical protein, partial [Thermogutta sp.]|uniref:hypothetical protein n=1 Tax=Thermogutta sp. TaxID=1962930 RepID=UPI0032204865
MEEFTNTPTPEFFGENTGAENQPQPPVSGEGEVSTQQPSIPTRRPLPPPPATQTIQPAQSTETYPLHSALSSTLVEFIRQLKPPTTLEISEEEMKKLTRPISEEEMGEIQIRNVRDRAGGYRPLVYLPWEYYIRRLDEVFGFNHACVLSLREMTRGTTVVVQTVLIIRQHLVGIAWGEAEYNPNNPHMGYTDSLEAAVSDSIRRLVGKRLGIGRELWNP